MSFDFVPVFYFDIAFLLQSVIFIPISANSSCYIGLCYGFPTKVNSPKGIS